jgi:hypothetical protein
MQDFTNSSLTNKRKLLDEKKSTSLSYKRYDIRESKWKVEFGKIREEKLRLKYP